MFDSPGALIAELEARAAYLGPAVLALVGLAVLLVLVLAMVLLLARRNRPGSPGDPPRDRGDRDASPDPWREAGRRMKPHSGGG